MKKTVALSLVVLSLGRLPAQDAPAETAAMPRPLPPHEQNARPDRGPQAERGPRPWKKDHPPAHAKPAGGPREKARAARGHGEILARQLGLTEDQKQKARAILDATQPKIEAIREESRAKVEALVADALKELRPTLTPEQQTVLDDLQKLRADRAALDAAQPKKQKKL